MYGLCSTSSISTFVFAMLLLNKYGVQQYSDHLSCAENRIASCVNGLRFRLNTKNLFRDSKYITKMNNKYEPERKQDNNEQDCVQNTIRDFS